jgi:hypothetical protein
LRFVVVNEWKLLGPLMRRLLRLLRRLGHDKFSIGVDRLFPDGGGISGREKGCGSDRARARFLQRVRIAPGKLRRSSAAVSA